MGMMLQYGIMTKKPEEDAVLVDAAVLWTKEQRLEEYRLNGCMFHLKVVLLDKEDDISYKYNTGV